MSTFVRRWSAVWVAVAAIVLFAPARVDALSCALPADASPQSIVAGTEDLGLPEGFFEIFDHAVTGRVTEIRTDERRGSSTYGGTQVRLEVINGFGVDTVPAVLTVSMLDPGWMNGYAFEQGRTYFVPIGGRGPDGTANFLTACDPISPLTADEAAALPGIAKPGLQVTTPDPTALVPADVTSDVTRDASFPWQIPAIGIGTVLVAAALASLVTRRRRPSAERSSS